MKSATMQLGGYTIAAGLSQDGTLTAQVVNRVTNEIEVEFLADGLTDGVVAVTTGISDEEPATTPTTSSRVEQVQPDETAFAQRPGMQRSRIEPGPQG